MSKKAFMHWLNRLPWWLWWLTPAACFVLGHDWIQTCPCGPACAWCGKGKPDDDAQGGQR